MFSSVVQPPILSLFSSASTDCLSLFSTHTDLDLPSDSFIHVLDDETSLPEPPAPQTLMKSINWDASDEAPEDDVEEVRAYAGGFSVSGQVLHIQSPTLPHGYIHCPPLQWKSNASRRARDLGIKLWWLHLQVRNMGRPWSFEVGVVDSSGREGRIRCSTFQNHPRLGSDSNKLPLLHLPLTFPGTSSRPLTAWCTISMNLSTFMSYFTSFALQPGSSQTPLPTGQFSHISYVRVYATCRLRRIWFTAEKRDASEPWDFGLYFG